MRSIIAIALILTALSLQAQVVPNATNADNVDGVSGAAINQDIAALHVATATERTARITTDNLIAEATKQNKVEIDDNKTVLEELASSTLVLYYTNEPTSSGDYLLMTDTIPTGAESTVGGELGAATVIITSFTVETPLTLSAFRAGLYHSHFHAEVDSVVKTTRLRFEVYKGTSAANTFLFSSEQSNILTTSKAAYDIHVSTIEILGTVGYVTVRIVADVTGGGADPVLTFYMEGDNSSVFEMPALLSEVGVTKIVAGTDIIITPTNGRGDVTINSDVLPSGFSLNEQGSVIDMTNMDLGRKTTNFYYEGSTDDYHRADGEAQAHDSYKAPNIYGDTVHTDAIVPRGSVERIPIATNTYTAGYSSATEHYGGGEHLTGITGGGNKGQAGITHKASAFWTDGYSNNASITKKQFEVGGSTRSQIYCKFTDSGDNYVITDGAMSLEWNGADFTAYYTFVTSGVAGGNVWLEARFSTASFDLGSFVTIESTTIAPATAWENGTVSAIFAVAETGLADGKDYILEIWRNSGDACTQTIYGKSAYLDINAD